MFANRTRPTVTIAQNVVRASEATAVDAPSSLVMYSCDQLPFIVSHTPYSTANPANSQNRRGMPEGPPLLDVDVTTAAVRSGSRRLASSRVMSRAVDSTGSPHQKPRP